MSILSKLFGGSKREAETIVSEFQTAAIKLDRLIKRGQAEMNRLYAQIEHLENRAEAMEDTTTLALHLHAFLEPHTPQPVAANDNVKEALRPADDKVSPAQ